MTSNPSHPPFQYSLKISRRVRGVKIAVKPYKGLEVIVPPRFPQRQIGGILQQHASWINRQLQKHQHSFDTPALPETFSLPLAGIHQQIIYHQSTKPKLVESSQHLLVQHATDQQAIALLRKQVRKQARGILPTMLAQVADEFGFEYRKTSIRSQKTRWGSCSSAGTISLNDQLVFLPPEIVRYLLIHELCHTRHMNHSADFWALVGQCCNDYRQHDQALNRGREQVPDWFSHSLFA